MTNETKIPDPVSKTPRCPLCYGPMEKMHNEMVQQRLEVAVAELVQKAKDCDRDNDRRGREKARQRLEFLDAAIKRGIAYTFNCHFCKIGVACNDPFVGRWEEVYARVGKEDCPSCETEMRFFCTATGFARLDCPSKKCRASIKRWLPDRELNGEAALLVDEAGNFIETPNIKGAVATPGQLADTVVNEGNDPDLPDVTTIPLK